MSTAKMTPGHKFDEAFDHGAGPFRLVGHEKGGLVISRVPRGTWTVSHGRSGMRVGGGFTSRIDAADYRNRLLDVGDWMRDKYELTIDKNFFVAAKAIFLEVCR